MTDNNSNFTARENEVLALAWQCFTTEPKVDITKLAALTGVRTSSTHPVLTGAQNSYTYSSALTTLGKLKARIKSHAASADTTVPVPVGRKTIAGRKKRAGNDEITVSKNRKSAKKNKAADLDGEDVGRMTGLGGKGGENGGKKPREVGGGGSVGEEEAEEI